MNSWITFWTINVSFSVSRQHLSSPKWSNQISVLEISGDTIYNTFNLEQLEMGQKTQILKLWCGNFPQYYLKCLLRFQTLSSPETGLPLRLFQQGSFQSKICNPYHPLISFCFWQCVVNYVLLRLEDFFMF